MTAEFLVLGISHQTADMSTLNEVSASISGLLDFRDMVLGQGHECVLVATCNRIEFYMALHGEGRPDFRLSLSRMINISQESYKSFYMFRHSACVQHLFRVISSLDSIVVGESQILAQIRSAYLEALQKGHTKKYLNRLFETAVALGKRVRTETSIGRGAVSVSQAAVELSRRVFSDFGNTKSLVIGAGEMGVLALRHLVASGFPKPLLMNRTLKRAVQVSEKLSCEPVPLENLEQRLEDVDLVFCAVSVSEPLIFREMIEKVMPRRRYKTLFLIDISLPLSIDPSINDLPSAFVYNIQDLRQVVDQNRAARESQKAEIQAIIDSVHKDLSSWIEIQQVSEIIKQIADMRTSVVENEANRWLKDYDTVQKVQATRMGDSIASKFGHILMSLLKDPGLSAETRARIGERITSCLNDN
jgi:glutamyl-tRNA reductase